MEQIKRVRRTAAEIKILLEEFSLSGISAKEFCALHDITEAGFYKWRVRHLPKPAEDKGGFVMLNGSSEIHKEAALFAELKGIRIYQPVAPSYLKELLS